MINIPVSAVMSDAASVVSPDTTTVEAAQELRRPDVPALVVCDATGAVAGIVTEADIVAVVAECGGNRPIESFMSTLVETTAPSTPISLAADTMRDAGVTQLPVVAEGTCTGLVTRDALTPYLSRHRLNIDWNGESLSLDKTDAANAISID